MYQFEDYLDAANQAETPEKLFEIFSNTLRQHGFDKILFALLTDHKDIKMKAGVGIIQNFPEDWMKHYFENSYDKIDPVPRYAFHQEKAFQWSDIEKYWKLKPIQKKCLNLGIESGLHNGIGITLRGARNQIAGISLASSEKNDACHFQADLITAYCNHFYLAYKNLLNKNPSIATDVFLTDREKEVLTWAAAGKTEDEISEILKLSPHTVHNYFRNIYAKLNANTKILAIVKGLNLGLIST